MNCKSLSVLFLAAVLSASCLASESGTIKPYLYKGNCFFSDRPLQVNDGRLVYADTGADFITANGTKVDASYKAPEKPLCVGCKSEENSPVSVLKIIADTKGASEKPVEKAAEKPVEKKGLQAVAPYVVQEAKQLALTKEEIANGGKRVGVVDLKTVVFMADGSYSYRNRSDEPIIETNAVASYQAGGCKDGKCWMRQNQSR